MYKGTFRLSFVERLVLFQSGRPHCVHLYTEYPLYIKNLVGASSGLDGYIKLWDLRSGKLLRSIDGGPGMCCE